MGFVWRKVCKMIRNILEDDLLDSNLISPSFFHLENVESWEDRVPTFLRLSSCINDYLASLVSAVKVATDPLFQRPWNGPPFIQLSSQYPPCGFLQDDPESRGNRARILLEPKTPERKDRRRLRLLRRCLFWTKGKNWIRIPESDTRRRVRRERGNKDEEDERCHVMPSCPSILSINEKRGIIWRIGRGRRGKSYYFLIIIRVNKRGGHYRGKVKIDRFRKAKSSGRELDSETVTIRVSESLELD